MSHLLKRLTLLADGGLVKSRYLLCANVTSTNSRDLNHNLRTDPFSRQISYGGSSGSFKPPSKKKNNAGGTLRDSLEPHRRSMSILTDLLRRKKKKMEDYEDEEEVETIPETRTLALFDDAPKALTEEEILAKRDISRLNPCDRRLVNGQHPYVEPMSWHHYTVRYKQRMFGKYGESSGVNPGLLWYTREDLALRREYEGVAYPFTIQELIEKKRLQRQQEKEEYERRRKQVEANMAIVDKFKEELARKIAAKEAEASEARARREKLMEEVRRHFGYMVDSRDERFQELLAKKEKEQKKQMKDARKRLREQKVMEKLQKEEQAKKKKEARAARAAAAANEEEDDD